LRCALFCHQRRSVPKIANQQSGRQGSRREDSDEASPYHIKIINQSASGLLIWLKRIASRSDYFYEALFLRIGKMAILHYRVVPVDHSWLISCEDVPIQAFDTEGKALREAVSLINTARKRGDFPSLFVRRPQGTRLTS
jgi:hypothetical protein